MNIKSEKGQGLAEYALILVILAIIGWFVLKFLLDLFLALNPVVQVVIVVAIFCALILDRFRIRYTLQ